MKNTPSLRFRLADQGGAAAVMVAVAMMTLLGFAAIAVDTGYLMVAKNELQNVADASALAAARQLGAIYEPMAYAEQQTYTCDPGTIIPVAQNVAQKNKAAGKPITIKDSDVVIGRWNSNTHLFTPTLDQPDAVKVTARRDTGNNGPVTTFFAKILGIDTADVAADAIAALTGQSTSGPGGLDIPVGISAKWFEPGFCNQPIKFYPTGSMEGCAGWHTFTSWPANASKLRNIMEDMTPAVPTFESPEAVAGQTPFVFTGGNVASAFDEMAALYEAKKDPATGEWETVVVVYDSSDCSNPTGNITVLGFATAVITGVNGPSDDPAHTIFAEVKCDNVEFGRGSGGNYGTKGSIPGLVE
jgi:Flp pilus assembly protein TadG